MSMNNPYAAYQKYARKPQINNNPEKEVSPSPLAKTEKIERKTENYPRQAAAHTSFTPVAAISKPINQSGQASNSYLENAVLTASPEELTLMLYDGTIKFMNQALIYITAKNMAKANETIQKAQNIFGELMSTLNMDYEVSNDLYKMYDFIITSLIQANIKKDVPLIREMISLTRDLRNTWAEAMKLAKGNPNLNEKRG